MDDPLIGLTIYNTTKLQRSGEFDKEPSVVQEELLRDDAQEDCFPCLPSLTDGHEKRTVSKKCQDNKLEEPPPPSSSTSNAVTVITPSADAELSQRTSQPKNFWLMRLFQSSLFNMSIAIGYLFNSKDPTVQSYLGSRLFVSDHSRDSRITLSVS